MSKHGKKYRSSAARVEPKLYLLVDAIKLAATRSAS